MDIPEERLEVQIGQLLRQRNMKLALAESCTGGLVGHRITNVPGASGYFLGGIIAYANTAKSVLLGVALNTLQAHGAVSRETALEMAHGARKALGADIALSVSGVAGPGGGLPGKSVGTTWVGLSAPDGEWARLFHFDGDRGENKALATDAALQLLLEYLQGTGDLGNR